MTQERTMPRYLSTMVYRIIKLIGDSEKALTKAEIAQSLDLLGSDEQLMKLTQGLIRLKSKGQITRDNMRYGLGPDGQYWYDNLETIMVRDVKQGGGKKSTPKALPDTPTTQIALIAPIHKASLEAEAAMSVVDDLVKENASLRAGLVFTMKNQLKELNTLRILLGYSEILPNHLPENRTDTDEHS